MVDRKEPGNTGPVPKEPGNTGPGRKEPGNTGPGRKVYTRTGDKGTTGLLFGGRAAKDSAVIDANGAVDEAQAALGVVRAEVERGSDLDELLVHLERELYVLMAELATAPENRGKLKPKQSLVTAEMVAGLETKIDELTELFPPLTDFVIPGHDKVSAGLDAARTAVRRAERLVITAFSGAGGRGGSESEAAGARSGSGSGMAGAGAGGGSGVAGAGVEESQVVPYLNRLSDLVWTMARWQEQGDSLLSRRAK